MKLKSICLVATVLLTGGCSEEDLKPKTFENPMWEVDLNGYTDAPVWKVDQMNNQDRPQWFLDMNQQESLPEYTLPDNHVMPVSMTAVLGLTPFLESYFQPGDKILAFVGDECRGEGVFKTEADKPVCFLQIKAPATETGNVSFLYYSTRNNAVYQTGSYMRFEANSVYGTVDHPEYPDFENAGKYPVSMQAVVCLPDDMPGVFSESDLVAAFVGNECRGTGTFVAGKTYSLEIRGKNEPERFVFRYYSSANKNSYKSEQVYPLTDKSQLGDPSQPCRFDLIPQKNMRAVVRLSDELRKFENTADDQVGAFVGDECRAVGTAVTENGETVYVMQIQGSEGVAENIDFRYYSANNNYLYQSDNKPGFEADGHYGSESSPEILSIDLSGKYPLKMRAYVGLPQNLHAFAGEADKLAVFVGDECRGTALLEYKAGIPVFSIDIIGKVSNNEDFIFRYYNQRNMYLYETSSRYLFEHQSELGSEKEPLVLTLINVN